MFLSPWNVVSTMIVLSNKKNSPVKRIGDGFCLHEDVTCWFIEEAPWLNSFHQIRHLNPLNVAEDLGKMHPMNIEPEQVGFRHRQQRARSSDFLYEENLGVHLEPIKQRKKQKDAMLLAEIMELMVLLDGEHDVVASRGASKYRKDYEHERTLIGIGQAGPEDVAIFTSFLREVESHITKNESQCVLP